MITVPLISHVLRAVTTELRRGEERLRVAFKARKLNKELNPLKRNLTFSEGSSDFGWESCLKLYFGGPDG